MLLECPIDDALIQPTVVSCVTQIVVNFVPVLLGSAPSHQVRTSVWTGLQSFQVAHGQSINFMPVDFTSLAHFSASAFMNSAASCGVPPVMSTPSWASC